MKKIIRSILKKFASWMPNGTLGFIYRIICRPSWLRNAVNFLILKIIPPTIKQDGIIFFLNKHDPVISGALMFGVYEPFEVQLFKKQTKPGQVVIDIGANIGYYAAIAAKAVGTTGKVIAFEPEPNNFACLEKTMNLNKFTNVQCLRFGISHRDGDGSLYLSENNMGDQQIYDNGTNRTSIPIKLLTLDSFLENNSLNKIDIIKMDIQGSEGLALKGMLQSLKNYSPTIFTEFWPLGLTNTGINPKKFLNDLQKIGYDIYEIDEIKKDIKMVTNFKSLIKKTSNNKYTNLFCTKEKSNL